MTFRVFFPFKITAERRDLLCHYLVSGVVLLVHLSYGIGDGLQIGLPRCPSALLTYGHPHAITSRIIEDAHKGIGGHLRTRQARLTPWISLAGVA